MQCQGLLKPGNIELPTDSLPPKAPSTSESSSTLLKYKNLKVISSSRDGWSPAQIRAANAEAWAWQEAAQREEDEESAAWADVDYEPEPGATTKDIRIYTKLGDGEYRYWGVQDLDETMEEFWARIDPDDTREQIAKQDFGPLPAPAGLTPSKAPSPRPRTAPRSKRREETPDGSEYGVYGVTYPPLVIPASKNGIRKPLAGNIEVSDPQIDEPIQGISNSSTEERTVGTNFFGTRWPDKAQTTSSVISKKSAPSTMEPVARGRPRKIKSGVLHSSSPNPAGWPTSMRDDPPKRKRGRPAKEKHLAKSQDLDRSYGSNEKQKRSKAESKAKVMKPQPRNGHPIAPSFHKMRTRARGPAENLQSF